MKRNRKELKDFLIKKKEQKSERKQNQPKSEGINGSIISTSVCDNKTRF